MPWKVSDTLDERMRFILAHESGLYSMTELCRPLGISRQNGYKWLARYAAEGLEGLRDRSRAPLTSPQRMQPPIEALLLQTRRERHHWGPRKILAHLALKHPELADVLPAASTVGDLFRRHHLVASRRRRIHAGQPPAPPLRAEAPNQVWTADFKGEFRLGSGVYCYPFTLADGFSRYLLTCQGQRSTALQGVQAALTLAFRTYGLPEADPYRPRHPVRRSRSDRPEHAGCLVDQARHPASTDRPGSSGSEWPTRTHAPHDEGGNDPAARRELPPTAGALRSLSCRLQPRSPA